MKALLWEGDGFVLLYKRLENGSFKWPREESELKPITWQQFRWLMEGLQVEQKQSIHPAVIGDFCDYSARFVPRIADMDTCNPWELYHLYAH